MNNLLEKPIDTFSLIGKDMDFFEKLLRLYSHGYNKLLNIGIKSHVLNIDESDDNSVRQLKSEILANPDMLKFFNGERRGWAGQTILGNLEISLNWKSSFDKLKRETIAYIKSLDLEEKYGNEIAMIAVCVQLLIAPNKALKERLKQHNITNNDILMALDIQEDYYGSFKYDEQWKKIRPFIFEDNTDPSVVSKELLEKKFFESETGKIVFSGILKLILEMQMYRLNDDNKVDFYNQAAKKKINTDGDGPALPGE